MNQTVIPAVAASSSADVDHICPCVRCGYELRGLDAAGVCPECAAPIALSTRRTLFRFASQKYLQTLATGGLLIVASIIGNFAFTIIGFGLVFAAAPARNETLATIGTIIMLTGPLWGVAWLIGWWKFSAREPGRPGDAGSARALSRLFLVLNIVALATIIITVFGLPLLSEDRGITLLGSVAVLMSGGAVMLIASILQYVFSMLYLSKLARRIPDDAAANWAATLTWLGPLIYVLGSFVVVGPLVALGLYCHAINRVRAGICRVEPVCES